MASLSGWRFRRQLLALSLAMFAVPPVFGNVEPASAHRMFQEAQAICARDAGAFWGRNLCGPMLLVDPADRSAVANRLDAQGTFKPSGQVFVGTLPTTVILANTAIEWSGIRWSEILWPL